MKFFTGAKKLPVLLALIVVMMTACSMQENPVSGNENLKNKKDQILSNASKARHDIALN